MNPMTSAAAALLLTVAAGPAAAAEPTAQEIVDKARDRSALNLAGARAKLRFHVVEAGGGTRERVFTTIGKKVGGRMHTVMRFTDPPEVAGVAMLVAENKGADADQSLYLPKLRRVRKVAAGQKSQDFLATDLTYADLAGAGLSEGSYERAGDEKVEGQDAYVLVGKPIASSGYTRVRAWVHKSLLVVLQAEFEKDGKVVKSYRVKRLKEVEPGRFVAMESEMASAKGSRTEITVLELDLKAQLADEEFTERALER